MPAMATEGSPAYTAVVVVVSACTLLANTTIMWVFARSAALRASGSSLMYVSLAAADTIVGVVSLASVSPSLWGAWPYPWPMCVACAYLICLSLTVSLWSLFALTMDRYLAICHALRYSAWVTTARVRAACLLLWLLACLIWLPPLAIPGGYTYQQRAFICGLNYGNYQLPLVYVITAFVPVAVTIIFCYVNILRAIGNLVMPDGTPEAERVKQSQNKKAVKTVGITVAAFFLAWTPFMVSVVLEEQMKALPPALSFIFTWLAFSNSFWNSIIYTATNKEFRDGTKSNIHQLAAALIRTH